MLLTSGPSTVVLETTTATASLDDVAVAAALSEDSQGSSIDLNVLTRNSWIVIGLLGFALFLILGAFIVMLIYSRRQNGQQYRSIPKARPYAHGEDSSAEPFTQAYAEQKYSEYTNPYTDKE